VGFEQIALQIAQTTRVITTGLPAKVGEPVRLTVLPGLNPGSPSTFELTGAVGATLSTLIKPVDIKVRFAVKKKVVDAAGNETMQDVDSANFTTEPALSADPMVSDPLDVAFLLKPPIGEDVVLTPAINYEIVVTVTVSVEGAQSPVVPELRVPVTLPALKIPAICILTQHSFNDSDFPGQVAVVVRATSPLRQVDQVVSTINGLMETVQTLRTLLGITAGLADFTGFLSDAVDILNKAPLVWFAVGNVPVFNDYGGSWTGWGGFDDEASAIVLIGPTGARVRVFSAEDFIDGSGATPHQHSTFTIADLRAKVPALAVLPQNIGIGFEKIDSFVGRDWDTTSIGDEMNDEIESVRWL
jgi:hypothetical protein